MLSKTEDDDDDGVFNDNGGDDDNDDDDGDVENEDDDDDNDDDGGVNVDDEGNFVDDVTANECVSNIKHLIGETRCFLKHKTLEVGEEITFTFCTTTSEIMHSFIRNNNFMNTRPNNIHGS